MRYPPFGLLGVVCACADLRRGGTVGGGHFVLGEVGCAGRVDAHGVGFGEGVLIGPEEGKLPAILFLLVLDHFLDARF